jgi:predicted nucleic acid-binding protein
VTRGWLLDTNVLSELAKGSRGDRGVFAWVAQAGEAELVLSVITLGEIAKGIGLAEARGRDVGRLREFFEQEVPARFGRRILAFDRDAAIAWARLMQQLRGNREEERRLALDAQIAAIAEIAELGICSRNRRDFERFGISVLDPFSRS